MNISITSPDNFKSIPWKNGKGVTQELAINPGGQLEDFDWRLSIASVVEDGPFSDFSGYLRNLILLEGRGIDLQHKNEKTGESRFDSLKHSMDLSTFPGSNQTTGYLHEGPIKDFNIMTRENHQAPVIETWNNLQRKLLTGSGLTFIFSLGDKTRISSAEQVLTEKLPSYHLATISNDAPHPLVVEGDRVITIRL